MCAALVKVYRFRGDDVVTTLFEQGTPTEPNSLVHFLLFISPFLLAAGVEYRMWELRGRSTRTLFELGKSVPKILYCCMLPSFRIESR